MGMPVALFEAISEDHERAQKFYAELFGWQVLTEPGWGGYSLVNTGAGPDAVGGGIGPSQGPGDTGVKIYVQVEDLPAALDRAEQFGGTPLVPPTDLPDGYGRVAMFADPDGNPVGLCVTR